MPLELKLVGAAVLIGILHLSWGAIAARRQQGLTWARGTRDQPFPVTGMAARLERAFANFRETFPFFVAAILVADRLNTLDALSYWGAMAYVVGRALYLPAYAFGLPFRTPIWAIATLGLFATVASIFI